MIWTDSYKDKDMKLSQSHGSQVRENSSRSCVKGKSGLDDEIRQKGPNDRLGEEFLSGHPRTPQ